MKTALQWATEINAAANEQGGFDTIEDMEKWIQKVQIATIIDCANACKDFSDNQILVGISNRIG